MRGVFTIGLIATILFAGGYFFYTAQAVCKVPIAYRIGSIDERFELTPDEARAAASSAESMWEDATGRNLFTYDEDAEMVINFVFDGRQQYTTEERDLRAELDAKRNLSEEVREQYEDLVDDYEDLFDVYEERKRVYEESLAAHNAEVARWNDTGGAPDDVYENLTNRQKMLSEEQKSLNAISYELNRLVSKINNISEEGNTLVSTYNSVVERYNDRFAEEHEFTQGDYQGDKINIYQFIDEDELRLVLAHEFGHALSLDHVEDEKAIMHFFMGGQGSAEGLTSSDLQEFGRVCDDGDFTFWPVL
jgi:hypothetical protein